MGNTIKTRPVEMKTLDLKMGNATVAGKVFSAECTGDPPAGNVASSCGNDRLHQFSCDS